MVNFDYVMDISSHYSRYVGPFIFIPIGFIISWYLSKVLVFWGDKVLQRTFSFYREFSIKYISPLLKPLSLLCTFFLFPLWRNLYPLNKNLADILAHFNVLLLTISVTWIITAFINRFFSTLREKLLIENKSSIAAMLPLINKVSKICVLLISLLFILRAWGFDVNALIAALGVGGIAVALASQKSIENLFGGIVIALDQPIRVGDTGKFNNVVGTILDIGLWSTRVQTPDRAVITIPNSKIASDIVETYAYRDKMLMTQNILIRYESTASQIQKAIKKINSLLKENSKLDKDARTTLTQLASQGVNLEIAAYILTKDFTEYLFIQQELILKIKEIISQETEGFSAPGVSLLPQKTNS